MVCDMLEHVTFNLANAPIRHETLDGRDYIVAPAAMMTEGVMDGSQGPLLYPKDEITKSTAAWNMKPVVVYHPIINGDGVSACNKEIIETQQVGFLMNTVFNDKLRTEAWIETDKAKKVDSRVVDALEQNKPMEVSTGLFTENEVAAGEFNGVSYTAVARDHQPDHLALLPDKVGAYSIKDGGGLLQLNESAQLVGFDIETAFGAAVDTLRRDIGTAMSQNAKKPEETDMAKEDLINDLIEYDGMQFTDGDRSFLEGLDEDQLVKMTPALYKDAGEYDEGGDNGVQFSVDGELFEVTQGEGTDAFQVNPVGNEATRTVQVREPVINEGVEEPPTFEELLDAAPSEYRDMIQNGLAAHNAEKVRLISTITANENNMFAADYLEQHPLGTLQAIAKLAGPGAGGGPTVNYAGAAGGPAYMPGEGDAGAMADGAGGTLETPVLNWDE